MLMVVVVVVLVVMMTTMQNFEAALCNGNSLSTVLLTLLSHASLQPLADIHNSGVRLHSSIDTCTFVQRVLKHN